MSNPEDEKALRDLMRQAHEKAISIRTYVDTNRAPRMMTEDTPKPIRHSDGRTARQDRVLRHMA